VNFWEVGGESMEKTVLGDRKILAL